MDSQTLQPSPSHGGMSSAAMGHASASGSLSVAMDRLDRALEALESRLQGLSGQASVEGGDEALRLGYQQALEELGEVRVRERALADAADGAYETLKLAAANIRLLLQTEVA